MFAPRSEYDSDSAPAQTDYSSQSESESYRHSSPDGKQSVRVGFIDEYESDEETYPPGKRKTRGQHSGSDGPGFGSNESLVESSGRSRSDSKSPKKKPKYPTTIQIKFDGFHSSSGVFFPKRSYAPNKLGQIRRGDYQSSLRNQEVTKMVEGFTKIDLSFMDDEPTSTKLLTENMMTSPKRLSSRRSRSRAKPDRELNRSTSCVKGKSLLGKFLNYKKS